MIEHRVAVGLIVRVHGRQEMLDELRLDVRVGRVIKGPNGRMSHKPCPVVEQREDYRQVESWPLGNLAHTLEQAVEVVLVALRRQQVEHAAAQCSSCRLRPILPIVK